MYDPPVQHRQLAATVALECCSAHEGWLSSRISQVYGGLESSTRQAPSPGTAAFQNALLNVFTGSSSADLAARAPPELLSWCSMIGDIFGGAS